MFLDFGLLEDLEVPDLPESYEDVSRPKMAVDLSEPMLRQELKFKAEIRQRTGKVVTCMVALGVEVGYLMCYRC